ncbi:hypothetical protein HU175_22410 [Spirosoma sp. KUDC1026]|nr:hypothetical protein HU175_22410 [Spirosoma sp. KUDC1026]
MALPVLIFFGIWQVYAVNVAKWDDHALREFLFNFDRESALSDKIYLLFKQHNEHRIVYDRIVTLLDYQLTGKLNFRHLMLIGNLSLVGLLALFVAILRREKRPVLYALPVSLLLFNLSQWENMYWGMAALQNFSVVLWVLGSLYFLSYTNRWGVAFLLAMLATLTSGNGMAIWPLGFVLLALQIAGSPTRLRQLLWWSGGAILAVVLYFTGFEKPEGNPPARGPITAVIKCWLAFNGSAAEILTSTAALRNSILLGSALVLLTLIFLGIGFWTYRSAILTVPGRFRRSAAGHPRVIPANTLFFWGSAAFLLMTSAVVAWSRTGFGADLIITSRYKIYALTLLALLYTYGVVQVSKTGSRMLFVGGLAGSFLLAGLSYLTALDETLWWRQWLLSNQFNWTHVGPTPTLSRDSVSQHYTDPAPAFYDGQEATLYRQADRPAYVLSVAPIPLGYRITNKTVPTPALQDPGNFVVARSAKRVYIFPVWQQRQTVTQARFLPQRLFTAGFSADILTPELEAGTYQLFVLTTTNGQAVMHPTNQSITVQTTQTDTFKKNW